MYKRYRHGHRTDLRFSTGIHTGYVLTLVENHPRMFNKFDGNKGYCYKHVVVMEKHLGRYLKPNEQVKFKDGNRSNCRLENLYLIEIEDKPVRYMQYIWIVLAYICADMYCNSVKIADFLAENHKEFFEYDYYTRKNIVHLCLMKLISLKFIKRNGKTGRKRFGGYLATKDGIKEVYNAIMDGRTYAVILRHKIGVWE